MIYVLIQHGTVVQVERRLADLPYTDSLTPLIDARLYHGALIPFFKPVPEELWSGICDGWLYDDVNGFRKPEPFSTNPETGKMFTPPQISAEDFYSTFTKAAENGAQLQEAREIIVAQELAAAELRTMLVDQELQKEGMAV